jgi:hypothetical protein
LIEADTGMPVGEGAQPAWIRLSISGGVKYQEIVSQALHLQKVDAHESRA